MTIIHRALTKAYNRRPGADHEKAREQRPASAGGWASTLRQPLRPIPSPDRTGAQPAAPPPMPMETPAPVVPVEAPATATVRLDPGYDVVKPPATAAAPPAIEPQTAPLSNGEKIFPLPFEALAGATVRIDRGHVDAKPQAMVEAQPLKPAPVVDAARVAIDAAPRWSWPPIVTRLLDCSAGAELRRLSASLKHLAATRRLGCLAMSGPGRSTGRTSLVLTLAHLLAESQSARVAIVDADFGHPQTADLLSLRPRQGLWDAACESEKPAAVVTSLIPEKLSIVPLVEPVAPEALDRKKLAAMQSFLRSLRRENDLVLVDAGPWEALVPPLVFESRAVDALLCVARHDSGAERLDDDHYRLPGTEWLGLIETFVPARELKKVGAPELIP
jgi:Mrp family chromosome partitioning ATPase